MQRFRHGSMLVDCGITRRQNITIDNYVDLFLVREQAVERIFSDNTSVNRFVISQAILRCLHLLFGNWTKDSVLYSINTDGFFMTNSKHKYLNKKEVKFKPKHIGDPYVTDSNPHIFSRNTICSI